ncbi:hypothetical protein DMC25_27050 [Caulobacter sp. D4A]|uniref:hypothetical protein n=1 Tax=unclassified Caulobacter TaxID=2648921 RepID=UPI000D72E176|nr:MULTISPECIES: hypothetical protein [unclassified Caulobacter]PXA70410.1 hypothetical protein DMC25_27050 [Caulobacter sp. D4A]PXA96817.1 hypothetical protein DMC18_00715 [Caulobacter sp. D5]
MRQDDTTQRLTSSALLVLADLEAKRLRAWDAGLLDASRKCVFAAHHVIMAVTGNYTGDPRTMEIMAWAYEEQDA